MTRITKAIILLTVALLLIVITTGCEESSNPKNLDPAQAFTTFMESMKQGNYNEAAQFVSLRTAADQHTDLPTFLAWMADYQELDKIIAIKTLSEKIDGTKAIIKVELTAEYEGEKGSHEMEFPMTKEDGIWKLYFDEHGNPKE